MSGKNYPQGRITESGFYTIGLNLGPYRDIPEKRQYKDYCIHFH